MSTKLPSKLSGEVASGVTELYQKFNCNYCQEELPGLRIKCAECPDFDLCLVCFSSGAQLGKHKNNHKYLFMNNGGFSLLNSNTSVSSRNRSCKRMSYDSNGKNKDRPNLPLVWNARDEMRLLDAVEQWGYGNWKEIANHIETKTPEQAKEEYIKHYIHGVLGKYTWREELRGYQIDHTQAADRGPLSPTLTGKLPPIHVSSQEALLLGYMPLRDDFEDFDKNTEMLVAQIADKSVEDDELDMALKLSQCDIYERRLREQVRRKRVARDYQLVSKFYRENPIVEIGLGAKFSPLKIRNQVTAKKKGDGKQQELMDAMKSLTQFCTAQEFHLFINNICMEKELKVRIRELSKYRENGLKKQSELIPFETQRFKRETRLKARAKAGFGFKSGTSTAPSSNLNSGQNRFLPQYGDYSLKAILDLDYEKKESNLTKTMKKRSKKSKWNRKKEKTGRRLLLKSGCILTLADAAAGVCADSTDGMDSS